MTDRTAHELCNANSLEIQLILRRWEIAYRVFVGGCVLICVLVVLAMLVGWIV